MAENSKIEWTDHTFNPWVGCTKVSPACDHCYAERWSKRSGMVVWGSERRRTSVANWAKPIKWNSAAAKEGVRRKVFCASLADVFDNQVPVQWRSELFALIEHCAWLDWLLLTKRIGLAAGMVPWGAYGDPWSNVWLGATVINQDEFDRDARKLLTIPARVRFLSVEPMLGPINFGHLGDLRGLHWVICGGESGAGARPLETRWAVDLRMQCKARGIAFFMKQGSQANWDNYKCFENFLPSVRVREFPEAA